MKVKVRCLCNVFLWVLRHGTVWHLAFPQASRGHFVCCFCPWNTLFIFTVYCTLHFLLWSWDQARATMVNWTICINVNCCFESFLRHWLNTYTRADVPAATHPKCVCCLVEIWRYRWFCLAKHIYFLCLSMLASKFYLSSILTSWWDRNVRARCNTSGN